MRRFGSVIAVEESLAENEGFGVFLFRNIELNFEKDYVVIKRSAHDLFL